MSVLSPEEEVAGLYWVGLRQAAAQCNPFSVVREACRLKPSAEAHSSYSSHFWDKMVKESNKEQKIYFGSVQVVGA